MYKIVLRTKEEADEFYKLVKALFMIQTELGNRYNFSTRINNENSIEFCYNGKKIEYGDLPEFIKDKYITTEATINVLVLILSFHLFFLLLFALVFLLRLFWVSFLRRNI